MPRFFFNIYDSEVRPDPEGVELADGDAAWAEAVRSCGEMLKDIDGEFPADDEWRMEVADDSGKVIFLLTFRAEDSRASV